MEGVCRKRVGEGGGGRKAHLLEDKQIQSVEVFDEVYLAFGRHLEEIHVTWDHLEKNRQDYGPTPTSLKIMFSSAGDGVTRYT
ncbi:hypothetical protein Tco_1203879 [Tanacetum coccineum]